MKTFRRLSVFRRIVLNRIEVRHATSGEPIPGLSARLVDGPPEWSIGTVNGDVVVSGPAGSEADAAPQVVLEVASPAIELFLDTGGDAMTVSLPTVGTREAQTHLIAPVEQDIEVVLSALVDQSDAQTVAPMTGATVAIASADAPAFTVTTTESDPGHYRTNLQQFPAQFNRFAVVVDGEELVDGRLMSWQTTTSIAVIAPD